MFSLATRVARPMVTRAAAAQSAAAATTQQCRFVQTVKEGLTATDAWNKSCYSEIDYTVNENDPVYEAVQKFAAYNIGCLVTVDVDGKLCTIIILYVCNVVVLMRRKCVIYLVHTNLHNIITII